MLLRFAAAARTRTAEAADPAAVPLLDTDDGIAEPEDTVLLVADPAPAPPKLLLLFLRECAGERATWPVGVVRGFKPGAAENVNELSRPTARAAEGEAALGAEGV